MEEDDDISSSEESAEDSENEYNTCHDQHASGGKTDATLNSAGSSDEAVRSKPSDNEEVEADKHSRENEAEKGPVMIPIPPLDKERDDGTNEGEAEVPVKDNGATNSEEPLHGETKVTDRDEGQLQEKRDVLTNDPLSSQQSFVSTHHVYRCTPVYECIYNVLSAFRFLVLCRQFFVPETQCVLYACIYTCM